MTENATAILNKRNMNPREAMRKKNLIFLEKLHLIVNVYLDIDKETTVNRPCSHHFLEQVHNPSCFLRKLKLQPITAKPYTVTSALS